MFPLLRVGLNKVALLRSSRGRNVPDLSVAAQRLIEGGCRALMVHHWPDERHIRKGDIEALSRLDEVASGSVELHLGSDLRDEVGELLLRNGNIRSWVVTPFDASHLTTQRGWQRSDGRERLARWATALRGKVRLSLFVDPEPLPLQLAKDAGAHAVELNCRRYVEGFANPQREALLSQLSDIGQRARSLGLEVHAAHDLNAAMLPPLVAALKPSLVSVGHAFIADALLAGLREALPLYLEATKGK